MWQIAAEAAHQLFCLLLCTVVLVSECEWKSCHWLDPCPRPLVHFGHLELPPDRNLSWTWWDWGVFSFVTQNASRLCELPSQALLTASCWAETWQGLKWERGERGRGTETAGFVAVGVRSTISYCLADSRSQHKRWHRSRGDIWLGCALAGSPDTVTAIQVGICCLLLVLVPPATDGCLTEHEDLLVWKPSLSSAPLKLQPCQCFSLWKVRPGWQPCVIPYPPLSLHWLNNQTESGRFDCPQVFIWLTAGLWLLIQHHAAMGRIFGCCVKPAWIFEQLRNQSSLKKILSGAAFYLIELKWNL